jgi:hypothetical protein
MTKTKDAKPDTRTQRQKFIDTAREHGADGNKESFRNTVRKIAAPHTDPAAKKSK